MTEIPNVPLGHFLQGIDQLPMAIRGQQLSEFEEDCASKNDREDKSRMPWVSQGKHRAQYRKRCIVFQGGR